MKLTGVVLAAGLGKRMNSSVPKVLRRLHGATMLQYVVDALRQLKPQKIVVVVGKHFEEIKASLQDAGEISFAEQRDAKGTGDALLRAVPHVGKGKGTVVVVNGDTPLITPRTLKKFLLLHRKHGNKLSLLSFTAREPESYGRIIRDQKGNVMSVIEDRDATAPQKAIREVNSGVYAIEPEALSLLKEIKLNESKGEYYLTDIVHVARKKGLEVGAFCIGSENEFIGVNTRDELERAGQLLKKRMIKRLADRGVNFIDANSVFLSTNVRIGKGTIVYPNVHLEGNTMIGKGCTIYPNVRIIDSIIGDGAIIKDSTLIEESVVKKRASVGPFAHLRPGSEIGAAAKIGNFVEIKKSIIGTGTKAQHLTYLGDAKIGRHVNIGAGTITCNYDGFKKYVTTIADNVFIGSDSQLIAPVKVNKGAYIGAGSTITKDVPSGALSLSRVEQIDVEGWAMRRKLKTKGERKSRQ
jgi:bifunctional UDP-N-acetylglucosamine pyrophosphorylase/glucosamine-1-phosphate N-acetyltransferase